jgi:hypothetical protein
MGEMEAIAAAVGLAVLGALAAPDVLRRWRGMANADRPAPSWWLWGDGGWKGWTRLEFVGWMFLVSLVPQCILWATVEEGDELFVVGQLISLFSLVLLVFAITTGFWGKPRTLVPKDLQTHDPPATGRHPNP